MDYERREDRRRAAHYILNYRQELEAYEAGRAQYLSRPADENGGRRGGIARPTENAALQGIEYDLRRDAYFWLRAVESVLCALPARRRLFVELRREAARARPGKVRGRRAWIGYIQSRVPFFLSEPTAKRWWSDLLDAVVDRQLRERIRIGQNIFLKK